MRTFSAFLFLFSSVYECLILGRCGNPSVYLWSEIVSARKEASSRPKFLQGHSFSTMSMHITAARISCRTASSFGTDSDILSA